MWGCNELTNSTDVVFVIVVQIPGLITDSQGVKCQSPVQVEEIIKPGVPVHVTFLRVQSVNLVARTWTHGLDVYSWLLWISPTYSGRSVSVAYGILYKGVLPPIYSPFLMACVVNAPRPYSAAATSIDLIACDQK